MCSPALKKATQALAAVFGPYLAARIEVEHKSYGRGTLVGLPYCHINDTGPLVTVEFDKLGPNHFPDYYELESVKPVLYSAEDAYEILKDKFLTAESTDEIVKWGQLYSVYNRLEEMAQQVDAARALGIALNLPEGSYIRKEVTNG